MGTTPMKKRSKKHPVYREQIEATDKFLASLNATGPPKLWLRDRFGLHGFETVEAYELYLRQRGN